MLCLIITLSALVVVQSLRRTPYLPIQHTNVTCGNSAEDAISRGCHFDVTSFSWLPEPCYDKDLAEEFISLTDWHWYRDEAATMEVPLDVVAKGDQRDLFVSMRYHVVHCMYTYRKLQRAMLRGTPIDDYMGKPEHADHCSRIVLTSTNGTLEELNTVIQLHFPSCPVVQ